MDQLIFNNVHVAEPYDSEDHVASLLGTYSYQSATVKVSRGDHAPLMQRMIDNLEKAKVGGLMTAVSV